MGGAHRGSARHARAGCQSRKCPESIPINLYNKVEAVPVIDSAERPEPDRACMAGPTALEFGGQLCSRG